MNGAMTKRVSARIRVRKLITTREMRDDSRLTAWQAKMLEELLVAAVAYEGAKQSEGEPLTRLALAAVDFARAIQ